MSDLIWNDIIAAIQQYGSKAAIYSLLLVFLGAVIKSIVTRKKLLQVLHSDRKHLCYLWLLLIYCNMVIYITLLSRAPGSRTGVNLELFATIFSSSPSEITAILSLRAFSALLLVESGSANTR